MSKASEAIKELQEELFVEEHGVTKEQARKLNEFIYWEPTGQEFEFWAGREVAKPSVSSRIGAMSGHIDDQGKRISELEWEHKKLWMGFWVYAVVSGVALAVIIKTLS